MYTKFNHRPQQQFAYSRKPNIKVLTKQGFEELIKFSSNPVQFEQQDDIILDPFTKKYRSQINLSEKYDQIENNPLQQEQIQQRNEFENFNKDHPYLLKNHPYPISIQYNEPQICEIKSERISISKAPIMFESSLFSGERIEMKRRREKRQEPFKLTGQLSLKHFWDIHKSYEQIEQQLILNLKMSDTETEHPYYKDILAYLYMRQIPIIQQTDLVDEFKLLSQFQFRLKLKLSTLYLAKSIYLRTNILQQDYLLTSLWIATKFDQQDRCKWQMSTQIETDILQKLNFEITKPTVMDFIEQLIYDLKKTYKINAEHVRLIYALSFISLPWKLNYDPSDIAISLIMISFKLKNKKHDFESISYNDVRQQLLTKHDENIIISQKYPSSYQIIKKNLHHLY